MKQTSSNNDQVQEIASTIFLSSQGTLWIFAQNVSHPLRMVIHILLVECSKFGEVSESKNVNIFHAHLAKTKNKQSIHLAAKRNEFGLPFTRNLSAKTLCVGHVVHIWHQCNHASSIAKLLHQPEIQIIIFIKTHAHASFCNSSRKNRFQRSSSKMKVK